VFTALLEQEQVCVYVLHQWPFKLAAAPVLEGLSRPPMAGFLRHQGSRPAQGCLDSVQPARSPLGRPASLPSPVPRVPSESGLHPRACTRADGPKATAPGRALSHSRQLPGRASGSSAPTSMAPHPSGSCRQGRPQDIRVMVLSPSQLLQCLPWRRFTSSRGHGRHPGLRPSTWRNLRR
jgi:hypothetical protein